MSLPPFISLSFSRTLFLIPPRLCFLVIWPPYLPSPWLFHILSSPSFFSLGPLCAGVFTSLLYSLFPLFVSLACSLSSDNKGIPYFAASCSQQIIYLDLSSLLLLYSPLLFVFQNNFHMESCCVHTSSL